MDSDEAPLIFWLLAGHFRAKPERLDTVGVFRLVSTQEDVDDLKLHISQGNYSYLEEVRDIQVVVNFWKKLLKSLREPLIPAKFAN